jgi:hypothetical protein
MKLYEIAATYREILDLADSDEDVDLDSFIPALDSIEADFSDKAGHVACYVRELELEATSVMEVAENAKTRAKRLLTRADTIRDYLLCQMQATGIKKIADPRISLALKKTPPSVFIPTPESIPADDRFWRVIPEKREPDKTAIKEALKAGGLVGDCELRSGERLEIK